MKRIGIFLLALSVAAPLSAQRYDVGGSVIDMNGITALDMFNYSQTSHNFGTARSMAMGGALTSLGGDMASMSINPAGLGMYRTNEITFTPMVGVAKASTDAASYDSNSSTRFSVPNFGFMFKAYEGTGKVLAVNHRVRLQPHCRFQLQLVVLPYRQPVDHCRSVCTPVAEQRHGLRRLLRQQRPFRLVPYRPRILGCGSRLQGRAHKR